MKHIRIALLPTLLLLTAAHVPQHDYATGRSNELYHAEVCNQGQIAVDVAVAYKDFGGFNDEFWMIDYWYRVDPGKCKLVYSHFYAPDGFQSFPLYLAYAFTDSTGVWGAAKVTPARETAASRLHLCVGRKNYEYRVNGKNPEAKCPKGLLIPAAIVWESTRGVYPNAYSRQYPSPKRFTVALGPNDRAIALGAQGSSAPAVQGPGDKMDLHEVLKDIMRGPGAPKPRISGEYSLDVCVPPTVVKKESWANPATARTKAFRETVRQFLASHSFSNATGWRIVRFRVTETGTNKFIAEEVTKCSGDFEFGLWSHHRDEPRPTAPPPAVKPAPKAATEPAPGFGDQMGPGGFIKPLPPK
jgi:Protein of unknown function (DUF1036)